MNYETESDALQHVGFRTANCIITGEPATAWTGHVMAKSLGGAKGSGCEFHVYPISITAGFKDGATMNQANADNPDSCFGLWKEAYGVEEADSTTSETIAALTSKLAAKSQEAERLRTALEGIASKTPRIERVTCERDKFESWCAFASRLQSLAALAAAEGEKTA
jgi:hypothetical protein